LKEKIKELENSLLSKPLRIEIITTIHPLNTLEDTHESSYIIMSASKLLASIIHHIGENIKDINIALIIERRELCTSSTILSSRIMNFKEYVQKDLDNDEKLCKEVVGCYDPREPYIGINVYDMTPRGGIYGTKCTCNV
jgi:hypothetical protein